MSTVTKPATQEDLRRAMADLISAMSPAERLQLQNNKSFVTQLDAARKGALLEYLESPQVLERRRQIQDHTGRLDIRTA